MSDNIDIFNAMTGVMLADLYASFPAPKPVDPADLYQAAGLRYSCHDDMGVDVTKITDSNGTDRTEELRNFHRHAAKWLVAEGFIRDVGSRRYVLTSKSLSVMNAHLESLNSSLGSKLQDAVSNAGGEAGRAVIGG